MHWLNARSRQLFLEEEREKELEAIYDANIERDRERDELRAIKEGDTGPEASSVSKTTTETLMAGERIAEALEISEEDRFALDAFNATKKNMTPEQIKKLAPRQRNPIFSIYPTDTEPEVHVLRVVQKIPPASLNDALLVLPFAKVVSMLKHLDYWAMKVRLAKCAVETKLHSLIFIHTENERTAYIQDIVLPPQNPLYPNCRHAAYADHNLEAPGTPEPSTD